ncbi:MFS transporter [Pseudonocardia cypriaca]|uniref:MFS transporter n=1 Tax=Pseudonocardia cypriaca TaxID=882449 RepID=A0A543GD77_9PSEU|nr:MFS transporter [Pseudonocardia cypriaca]TQM44043.1 MFS transporter [Pseudonocardia cypriaca]
MAGSGLGAVFRVPEFRVLWAAELFSIAGDQLARVALAVLVYGRTGSALWAAVAYALTFLPALLGGVLLSGLADRFRRREVMIVSDVARAVLVAVMAIPDLPLWALCAVLVLVVLLGSPHTAAQGALYPEVLPGELYERGLAVRQITSQTAQLVGFATGGLLVAALSPAVALLGNAVSFALSAVVVRIGVADRPAPVQAPGPGPVTSELRGITAGLVEIATDRPRRALVLLAWLVGWYVVPEALAAPYADHLGAGPAAVGLLMAADPLGSVLGAWLFVRFVPAATRARLVGLMAVAAGVPLALCILRPGVPLTVLLWAVSGMLSTAYLLQTQASFVRATPDGGRGRAIGVAASGIIAAQGAAVLLGGLLADATDPATAVAAAGVLGAVLSAGGAVAWHRANSTAPSPQFRWAGARSR